MREFAEIFLHLRICKNLPRNQNSEQGRKLNQEINTNPFS